MQQMKLSQLCPPRNQPLSPLEVLLLQIMNDAHHTKLTFTCNPTSGPVLVRDEIPHPNEDWLHTSSIADAPNTKYYSVIVVKFTM